MQWTITPLSRSGRSNRKNKLFVAFFALVFMLSMTVQPLVFNATADHDPYGGAPQTKVKVCHYNSGHGGSYNGINVSITSSGAPQGGHEHHNNDIIPPYHWTDGNNVVQSYPGSDNWDEETEAIWNDNVLCPGSTTTGTLTLVKVLTGDLAPDANTAWTLTATGSENTIFGITGSTAVTSAAVESGNYDLTESGPTTNYTAGIAWNCGQATMVDSNTVTLATGANITCTITNTYDEPATTGTLIVKKVVINDNGGTSATSSFSFMVNGGTAQSFEADGQNDVSVTSSNGPFSVTEVTATGYTTTYNNCSAVNVSVGGSTTCTITNNDNAPTDLDVSVTKTASDTTPNEGDTITYTLVVANAGPVTSTGIVLTDVLPAGITYVSDNGGDDTEFTAGTLTWNAGALTAGQSVQLVVTVTVASQTGGTDITNTANIPVENNDTNSANNTDSEVVSVNEQQGCTSNCTPLFSLSGLVYNDNDTQNGTFDGESEGHPTAEPGLTTWTIYLDTNNDDIFNEGDVSTVSDENGNYQFSNLVAGCYTVREVTQDGWTQTEPTSTDDFEYQVSVGGPSFCVQISFLDHVRSFFGIDTASAAVNTTNTTGLNFGNVQNQTPSPTPTPTNPPSGGGGGGGGGGSVTFTPATPTPTPEVLGAATESPAPQVLPATGFGFSDRLMVSLFMSMIFTGLLMTATGYRKLPKSLLSFIER